jgi:hypothetical protein
MTEYEQKLLQHLEKQAEQLTQLSVHQRATSEQQKIMSSEVLKLQNGMSEILQALQKEPSGESLETTLKAALQPLEASLDKLITSFNSLSNISRELSEQLPPQQKK